LKNLSYILIAI